jgi:hypothetical protein
MTSDLREHRGTGVSGPRTGQIGLGIKAIEQTKGLPA